VISSQGSVPVPDFNEIAEAVIGGDAARVSSLVEAALAAGVPAADVLEHGLTAGMAVIGRRFRANEIFVPEVLVAARAMKAGLGHLEPIFSAAGVTPVATFVIGTVRGDIHDIGKNLVAMMLRGAGFSVVDVGVNVAPPAFVAAVQQHGAQLVGLSALLTTTMVQMRPTIDALRAASPDVKVLVGGAPVSPEFAASIGADGYGANATDAVERALELVGRAASS
jgi:5-methyltetrahydrofolate--homocysteine methyltransferase